MKSAWIASVWARPLPTYSHSESVARRLGSTARSRSTAIISIDKPGRSNSARLTSAAAKIPEPAPGSSTRRVPTSGKRGIDAISRAAAAGVKNCPSSLCLWTSSPPRAATRSLALGDVQEVRLQHRPILSGPTDTPREHADARCEPILRSGHCGTGCLRSETATALVVRAEKDRRAGTRLGHYSLFFWIGHLYVTGTTSRSCEPARRLTPRPPPEGGQSQGPLLAFASSAPRGTSLLPRNPRPARPAPTGSRQTPWRARRRPRPRRQWHPGVHRNKTAPSVDGAYLNSGGAKGIRTPGLFHAMEARYQLRHSPASFGTRER